HRSPGRGVWWAARPTAGNRQDTRLPGPTPRLADVRRGVESRADASDHGMAPALEFGMTRELVPTRRRFLVSTGLGPLGLTTAALRSLRASTPATSRRAQQLRQNSCVFLFLFGGPSHIDLWDMKPDAPEAVRGEFAPATTAVPGVRVCEHLPRFARVMDRVCLLRSMTHRMNVHGPACSEVLTGRPYFGPPTTDQA